MKDYFYLNPSKMMELSKKMDGSEIKVLLLIMANMSDTHNSVFINCKESREMFASMGYAKTPERISSVLSSMVKKGIIVRKGQGIFALPDMLFIDPEDAVVK